MNLKITTLNLIIMAKGIATIAILAVLYAYHLISLKTALYIWVAALLLGSLLLIAVKAAIADNKKRTVGIEAKQQI